MRPSSFSRLTPSLLLLAGTSLVSLAAGCASLAPGDVAEKWSATMRELQIVPVFPPREDVYIGDIYFLPSDTAEGVRTIESRNAPSDHHGFLPIPVLVGRLNLGQTLHDQYARTTTFGDTDSTNLDPSGTFSLQPSRANSFSAGPTDRPRIVGFPEFMSATFSQGDLSALVPIEALKVSVAAGFTSAKNVTVRIPVAESYSLPLSAILAGMLDANGNLKSVSGASGVFTPAHVTLLTDASSDSVAVGDTVGFLRVVNEVYLARVVDVSITGTGSFGASGRAEPLLPLPAGAPDADTDDAVVTPAPDAPVAPLNRDASTASVNAAPVDLANRLNNQLDEQISGLSPGVSTRFVTASASSIGLRTVYERPVAVGYRGVLLRLAKNADGGVSVAGLIAIDSMKPTEGGDVIIPTDRAPAPTHGS